MADTKISALTAATTPLAGTEVLPIVQSGVTKQVSVANLTAGRNTGMTNAVVSNGIVVQTSGVNRWIIEKGAGDSLFFYRYNDAGGYAGNPVRLNRSNGNVELENNIVPNATRGIDYSANTSAAGKTSQLLNWYEEGTWTPTDASGASLSFSNVAANYTRIGRQVTCFVWLTYPATASGSVAAIGGLPFSSASLGVGMGVSCYSDAGFQLFVRANGSTSMRFVKENNTNVVNADLTGKTIGVQYTFFA